MNVDNKEFRIQKPTVSKVKHAVQIILHKQKRKESTRVSAQCKVKRIKSHQEYDIINGIMDAASVNIRKGG